MSTLRGQVPPAQAQCEVGAGIGEGQGRVCGSGGDRAHLRLVFDFVGRLLKLADLPDDVGYLWQARKVLGQDRWLS